MDFVTIDFETANEKRSSPCSVGVCVVEGGKPTEPFTSLIRPQDNRFNEFNTRIHGITADDVKDSPEFPDVWRTLQPMLAGKIVLAHNASFDMSVLRNTLDLYELPYPELTYNCTLLIAKRVWQDLLMYRLSYVAKHLGIEFNHHLALEDANACAAVACKACEESGCESIDELANRLELQHCQISERHRGEIGESRGGSRIKLSEIVAENTDHDPGHSFYQRVVVFTGTLGSMPRKVAWQIVSNVGGEIAPQVTKKTDYLVIGEQDSRFFATDAEENSKVTKAKHFRDKGSQIELISEDDFLRMVEYE